MKITENSGGKKGRNPRQGRPLELGGVSAQAAKVQKTSHGKEKNFFRSLFLKPQGQGRVRETRNFRKDGRNENGQLPKIKLGK